MRVRFRTVLTLALLGMLFVTGVLVAVASYFGAQASARDLANRVIEQATERIGLRIRAELDIAEEQSRLNALLIDRNVFSVDQPQPFGMYLLDVMTAHPELSYLSLGLQSNGNMYEAMRPPSGELGLRFLQRQADGTLQLTDYRKSAGELVQVKRMSDVRGSDPRPRPYYVAAQQAKKPVWTESYLFFGEGATLEAPGITYATPLTSPDGSLLGVLTADFDLLAISKFLASLEVLQHGVAFVVENRRDGTRRVVAHPRPEILSHTVKDGSTRKELMPVEQLADARVTALVAALPPTGPFDGSVHYARFALSGVDYVGSFRALRHGELAWVVCFVAPESDILGPARRTIRNTALIVGLGMGLAVFVAIFLATTVARALRALAVGSEAIGRLDLESSQQPHSRIVEIEQLSASMEEMKRGLRSFRKYVSADLVRELLARGQEAAIGGMRRRLTIHFSDIAGFTTIAEQIAPEELVKLLGEYLEAMTQPILASGGTVDKYIGDAVMAFWGAPLADDNHAIHACEAALINRERLTRLNASWEAQGRPRLDARAALHTGDVIVGNIGSSQRLEYTVIGDAVNLASRLEGLNKLYGTSLLISDTTYALVRHIMVVRPLDRVSVKGKAKSVDIYELLGKKDALTNENLSAAQRCTEAFELYLARQWHEASALWREHLRHAPGDRAALVLAERCDRFALSGPGPDWDGTEKIDTK